MGWEHDLKNDIVGYLIAFGVVVPLFAIITLTMSRVYAHQRDSGQVPS
jgi:hypothetical protein